MSDENKPAEVGVVNGEVKVTEPAKETKERAEYRPSISKKDFLIRFVKSGGSLKELDSHYKKEFEPEGFDFKKGTARQIVRQIFLPLLPKKAGLVKVGDKEERKPDPKKIELRKMFVGKIAAKKPELAVKVDNAISEALVNKAKGRGAISLESIVAELEFDFEEEAPVDMVE